MKLIIMCKLNTISFYPSAEKNHILAKCLKIYCLMYFVRIPIFHRPLRKVFNGRGSINMRHAISNMK